MTDRDRARNLLGTLIEAYNSKDVAALEEIYDEEIRLWTTLGGETRGRDAVLGHVRELFDHLPDETMHADTIVGDDSTLVVELTSRGTTPAGESYELQFTEVFEIRDGAITEIRTYVDPDDVEAVTSR